MVPLLLWSLAGHAQAPAPDSSAQAVAVLTQSLSASGAANPAGAVRSFTANGTATFFLPGPKLSQIQQVQGNATIRVRGADQFRVDASLPGGVRSLARNRNTGARKDESGKLTDVPLHNTVSMGGCCFPYAAIASALTDSSLTISYIGLFASGTQKLHQVRIRRNYTQQQDPTGLMGKLSQTDFFVDSQTNLIATTADVVHPKETATRDIARETQFEAYSNINGVAVPMVVREKLAGQTTWELHLASITFNTALTDTDFTVSK